MAGRLGGRSVLTDYGEGGLAFGESDMTVKLGTKISMKTLADDANTVAVVTVGEGMRLPFAFPVRPGARIVSVRLGALPELRLVADPATVHVPNEGARAAVPAPEFRDDPRPHVKRPVDFRTVQEGSGVAPLSAREDLETYFPVRKGAWWEYQVTRSVEPTRSVRRVEVVNVEERPPFQQSAELRIDGADTGLWDTIRAAMLTQVEEVDSAGRRLVFFGPPPPSDAEWMTRGSAGRKPQHRRQRRLFTVNVPAGRFTDCVEIVELTPEMNTHLYYAPRVGLVLSLQVDPSERVVSSVELAKYQLPEKK